MLSRICHKLQEHKPVCLIHGENLIDVPFGMFLSGGLDSLVVTMASRHLNDIEVANV
jgi:asparagine synthetase B (glutamine-hydrolysing)